MKLPSSLLTHPKALEEYQERAAIMEYDGGMSRVEAERAALELTMRRWRLEYDWEQMEWLSSK